MALSLNCQCSQLRAEIRDDTFESIDPCRQWFGLRFRTRHAQAILEARATRGRHSSRAVRREIPRCFYDVPEHHLASAGLDGVIRPARADVSDIQPVRGGG